MFAWHASDITGLSRLGSRFTLGRANISLSLSCRLINCQGALIQSPEVGSVGCPLGRIVAAAAKQAKLTDIRMKLSMQ